MKGIFPQSLRKAHRSATWLQRFLFFLLLILSLLVFMAAAVSWPRSSQKGDWVQVAWPMGGRFWYLEAWSCKSVFHCRFAILQRQRFISGYKPWPSWIDYGSEAVTDELYETAFRRVGFGRFVLASFSNTMYVHAGYVHAGLYQEETNSVLIPMRTWDWAVAAPHWFVLILAMIVPGVWIRRFMYERRRRLRYKAMLCRDCGYDLRASPQRCPECGIAVVPHASGYAVLHASGRMPWFVMVMLGLGVSLIVVLGWFAPSRGSLSATIRSKQVAQIPIVFDLSIANAGTVPFYYWCGGPDQYPAARYFRAIVRNSMGQVRAYPLSNGQYEQGSGSILSITPGKTVSLPAAMEPLPLGTYTLLAIVGQPDMGYPTHHPNVNRLWPAVSVAMDQQIEVQEDQAAALVIESDLISRVRASEPFAKHLSIELGSGMPKVIAAMMADLASTDHKTVSTATIALRNLRQGFPADLGMHIKRATDRLLNQDPLPGNTLANLCYLAQREGSDASLDAVLACVRAPRHSWGDQQVWQLQELRQFKQPRAIEATRTFLDDPDPRWRFRAAYLLAVHRDPKALEILLASLDNPDNSEKSNVFYCLEYYYLDDPRVKAAAEKYLNGSDVQLRSPAQRLLGEISKRATARAATSRGGS